MSTVAILGAGNGAHAMAGHLGMRGFAVRLYNRFEEEIAPMQERGGVEVEGAVQGFGPVELVSTDIAPVLDGAEVIMVVVPAFVHRFMAETCAPYLQDGQVIVLNPGRTGGAMEFRKVLEEKGCRARVYVAEAQTLIYACRISGPARVRIAGIKQRVPLAALPATDTPYVLEKVTSLYPQFVPAANVLETSLDNIGAIFHPAATILNANRIEAGEDFEFYRGMTPSVTRVMEAVDKERLAVCRAFGVEALSAANWLVSAYEGVTGRNLYECIQSNKAYAGIKAPKTLKVRYLTEDVPTGLVPIVSLAKVAGLSAPISESLINIAGALLGVDFWETGRTPARLGIEGMTVEEIIRYVEGR